MDFLIYAVIDFFCHLYISSIASVENSHDFRCHARDVYLHTKVSASNM